LKKNENIAQIIDFKKKKSIIEKKETNLSFKTKNSWKNFE
jgi:hypothetical protein